LAAAKSLSPEEKRLRAQIAINERWAKIPPEERSKQTAAARMAFNKRFEGYADPDAARRAYMARLSYQGLRARRRKAVAS